MRSKRSNTSSDLSLAQARRLLGIDGPMAPDALKAAFRAAAKAARPGPGDPNSERLRQVIEAYQFLQTQDAEIETPGEADPAATVTPGGDLHISLREALFGLGRSVTLARGRKLGLRLPAGLRNGDLVRLPGQADGGADLYLKVCIDAPASIDVMGDHMRIKVPVERHILEHGGRVDLETPHGKHSIQAPKALPANASVRVRGLGLPARGKRPAGDLYIKLEPITAAARPSPARDLLRKFSQAWT